MSTLAPSHDPANREPAPARPKLTARTALPRLLRLHLASRRAPTAVAALAVIAPLMQWAVRGTISQGGTPGAKTAAMQIVLLLESMAAAVVGAAMHGPFGESERSTGRRLLYLRATTALVLTGGALAALSLGAAGTGLSISEPALLRDSVGFIGIGLLGTVVVGGHFAWTGPTAYFVIAAYAVSAKWTTPWVWPARPGGDTGAALCALGLFLAATLAIAVKGPRSSTRD